MSALVPLDSLGLAACTVDGEGRLTAWNAAALALWGVVPDPEASRWTGAWRLHGTDGREIPARDCALARAMRGETWRADAVAERPDGTRQPFRSTPSLLRNAAGEVVGGLDLMSEVGDAESAALESQRLAAIVSSSEDAIVGKTLDGIVTSWNAAAGRIFGYTPEEMIGQSILRIIPEELRHEEARIIASLRRGERVEHFDTVRIRKDGGRVDVSLTISPIRDRAGRVVGASKIARDVTERRRAESLQRLLVDELNHRVKNTLAMIQAIASQSLRRASNPQDFVAAFNGRVQALARAHDLLVARRMEGAEMQDLVREQVMLGAPDARNIACDGPRVLLEARSAVQLALVLHELATNARKYGALAQASGRLAVTWTVQVGTARELHIDWVERGVPDLRAPRTGGFGTTLIERSLESNGGTVRVRYGTDGLACHIRLPLANVDSGGENDRAGGNDLHGQARTSPPADYQGKRILVVEDEPLVALEIESELEAIGCSVVGPAATAERALELVATAEFDAALVDANLRGDTVEGIVAAITRKGVSFAFATGYGREALPLSFRDAPLLAKPFGSEQLLAMVGWLLRDHEAAARLPRRPDGR